MKAPDTVIFSMLNGSITRLTVNNLEVKDKDKIKLISNEALRYGKIYEDFKTEIDGSHYRTRKIIVTLNL